MNSLSGGKGFTKKNVEVDPDMAELMDYIVSWWEIELEYLGLRIQYPANVNFTGQDNGDNGNDDEVIVWTDHTVFLVELIYSIHGARSINHGRITKKALLKEFGKFFNVDLLEGGYRAYTDITRRTGERSKYIGILRDSLEGALIEKDAR